MYLCMYACTCTCREIVWPEHMTYPWTCVQTCMMIVPNDPMITCSLAVELVRFVVVIGFIIGQAV